MSTELGHIGDLALTRFWGGKDRGVCVQFTPMHSKPSGYYSELSLEECRTLRDKLDLLLETEGKPVAAAATTVVRVQRDGCAACGGIGWRIRSSEKEGGSCSFSIIECSTCVTYHDASA